MMTNYIGIVPALATNNLPDCAAMAIFWPFPIRKFFDIL